MVYYIGCDAHKKYSVFTAIDEECRVGLVKKVEHEREGICRFLSTPIPSGRAALPLERKDFPT